MRWWEQEDGWKIVFNKFHIYTFRKSLTQFILGVHFSDKAHRWHFCTWWWVSGQKYLNYRRRHLYYLPPMESHSGGLPKVLSKLWNSSYKYAMLEQEDGWKNMMQPLICLNLRGQSCPWMLARPIYGPGDRRSYNFNFNDVFFSRCLRTGEARAVTGCGQGVQCDVWQVAGPGQSSSWLW